jgi:hypothetical protein
MIDHALPGYTMEDPVSVCAVVQHPRTARMRLQWLHGHDVTGE